MTNEQYKQLQQLIKLANTEIRAYSENNKSFDLADALMLQFATHDKLDSTLFNAQHINEQLLIVIERLNIILEQLNTLAIQDNHCHKHMIKLKANCLISLGCKAISHLRTKYIFAIIMSGNSHKIDRFHESLNKLTSDFKKQQLDKAGYDNVVDFINLEGLIEYLKFLLDKITFIEKKQQK